MSYTTRDRDPDEEDGKEWTDEEAEVTPVSDLRCVWCKTHMEEWPDERHAREIDTGEVLCEPCLKDLRKYKRAISWLFVKHPDFEGTEVGEIMERHLNAMEDEVHEWFEDNVEDYAGMGVRVGTSNGETRELETEERTATDGGEDAEE